MADEIARQDKLLADEREREDKLLANQIAREDLLLKGELDRENELLSREESGAEMEYARQLALQYGLIDPANIGQIKNLADLAALSAGTAAATGGNPTSSNPADGGLVNNGGLSDWQVREMQGHYGLVQDGKWGPNSQSTTGMSAQKAWTAYQASKARTSIGFDEDEGTITWNGKTYIASKQGDYWTSTELIADMNAANLTDAELEKILRKTKPYMDLGIAAE